MSPRLVVLGGSSPFTAALVDALDARAGEMPPHELVLYGRSLDALHLLSAYAANVLGPHGWSVAHTQSLDAALDGASVVLNQIRYGGLRGRAGSERLAERFGSWADETLGVGGLCGALRAAEPVARLGRHVAEACPDAWVLNLVNPLSAVTALLVEAGVRRCVGLCELPLTTAREASRVLDLPPDEVDWSYAGLNHRGFVCGLRFRGEDHLPRLPAALGRRTIGGIGAEVVEELGALPLKYFKVCHAPPGPVPGRARFLEDLRGRILRELRHDPTVSPPGLRHRDLSWYPEAVVPMLEALCGSSPRRLVVNLPGPDGFAVEVQALVSAAGVEPLAPPAAHGAVADWLERFGRHELAVLAAARDPRPETVEAALRADPAVPREHVAELAQAVLAEVGEPGEALMHGSQ